MSVRRSRLTVLAALLIAVPLIATGCTPSAPAPSPSASKDTVGLPAGVQQATDVPVDVPNDPTLRKNVTISDCVAADGGWQAKGTATNPSKDPIDYTISVFFTTDKGTVLGTADTKVTVKPDEKTEWTVKAALTPAPKTLCVLRGVG